MSDSNRQGTQQWIASADDGAICFYTWHPKASTPCGIVQMVHGSIDHARRYGQFAEYLAAAGYIVVASDNRGHGNAASISGGLGATGPDAWNGIVGDLDSLSRHIQDKYPSLPLYLVGHAMGTLLVLDYAQRYGDRLSGMVLSSPLPPTENVDQVIGALEAYVSEHGPDVPAEGIEDSIAKYNAPFEPATSKWAWFTRDPEQLLAYEEDPQCGFVERVGFLLELSRAEKKIRQTENMAKIPRGLPVLILAGQANPVVEFGQLALTMKSMLEQEKFTDVTSKIYTDARHQLLHEVNREEVYQDILEWIEQRAS